MAGCLLAAIGTTVINHFLADAGIHLGMTPSLLALGIGLSVLMGTCGGLYPAWRAARLLPMDAIRLGLALTTLFTGVFLMIEVVNVYKSYRSGSRWVQALRGLSCRIEQGRFAFIVGPSGSGKSSLLYLLGAIDRPTSGEIVVDGQDLGKMSESAQNTYRRDRVGFIFQSFNLISNLTALENVLVPFLPKGVTPGFAAAGRRPLEPRSASKTVSTTAPTSSPAASSNESRSPGRS